MMQEAKEELAQLENLELFLRPSWNLKQLSKALGMSINTLKKQEWFDAIPYIPMGQNRIWLQEDVISTLKEYRILDGHVYKEKEDKTK